MLPAVSGQVGKHNHEIRFRAKIIASAVMGVNGAIGRGGASAHGEVPEREKGSGDGNHVPITASKLTPKHFSLSVSGDGYTPPDIRVAFLAAPLLLGVYDWISLHCK